MDVSCLYAVPYVSGIQRVVIEVCCGLIERKREVELIVGESNETFLEVDSEKFYDYYKCGIGAKQDYISGVNKKYSDMDNGAVFFDVDAVWNIFCRNRNALYPELKKKNIKIVTYIHDLIPINLPDTVDDTLLYNYANYINAAFLHADVIMNQTKSGAGAISSLMKELGYNSTKCYATWLGADFGKKSLADGLIDEEVKKVIDSKYILMTGTLEVRKNHKVVLDAFDKALFDMGLKLVFVGREDLRNEDFLNRVLEHDRLNKDLFFLNRLNDESLDLLYRKAFMLAFPSYDEGFGLPIVESLVRGTPVITADLDVMREVGGELILCFEQDDVDGLISVVKKYYEDANLYSALKEKIKLYSPKTWDEVIDGMEDILFAKD